MKHVVCWMVSLLRQQEVTVVTDSIISNAAPSWLSNEKLHWLNKQPNEIILYLQI